MLRPVQKQALAPVQVNSQPELAGAIKVERLGPGEVNIDAQRAAQLKEHTIELIKQKPVNTARAVQAWLREEPS